WKVQWDPDPSAPDGVPAMPTPARPRARLAVNTTALCNMWILLVAPGIGAVEASVAGNCGKMGTNRDRMRGISDHFAIVCDMRVVIAPVNGCFTSGLTTLLDVLQTAEGLRRSLNVEIPSIDVEIGGCSDTVVTRNGLTASVSRRLDRQGCADLD